MAIDKGEHFNPYDLGEVANIDTIHLPKWKRRRALQASTASSGPVDTTKGFFASKVEKVEQTEKINHR